LKRRNRKRRRRAMADRESNEIWGTFSVRDHQKERAFVAEVLLFDKLVIPVPPKDEPEQLEWWNSFDPERQKRMVGILGKAGLVKPVEWKQWRRDHWQQQWKESRAEFAEQTRKDLAFEMTAMMLMEDEVPAHATGKIAASTYTSLQELEDELEIEPVEKRPEPLPGHLVSAIVGRKLLIPEAQGHNDFELLEEAVAVAGRDDYREARRDLHKRLRRFVDEDDKTDLESIRAAVTDMDRIITEMRMIRRKKRLWSGVRRAMFFTQLAMSIPLAAVPILAIGNAAIALGAYTASEKLSAINEGKRAASAAMLLDARSGFDLSKS